MRYKIELRNSASNRPNNMTFVWIENNRWDQGNHLARLGSAVRVGRFGQGTVSSVQARVTSLRGQLYLMEGNNCILELFGPTPILVVGNQGDGTYTGPPGILTGATTWRVVDAN